MEPHLIIALALALGIGWSLGLLGSGGSILTLPVLVYAAGVPAVKAVGMSLAIVGATSLAGAWWKHRQGLVHWRAAALFGSTGMAGSMIGAQFTRLVSSGVLMLIFGALMALVAARMLAQGGDETIEPLPDCRPVRCGLAGLAVGLLTGFIGVGGGFLLVPAMVLFARLPVSMAVGTSLAVIAANSLAGWLAHLESNAFAWGLTGAFLLVSVAGMAIGAAVGVRLRPRALRLAFGWFVLAVAVFVLAKNWPRTPRNDEPRTINTTHVASYGSLKR